MGLGQARWRGALLGAALGALLGTTGCAAVIKGRTAPVRFASDPPGAEVYVDGALIGTTPMTANLEHGNHGVVAKKAGFADADGQVRSSFSGHSLWLGVASLLGDALMGTVRTIDDEVVALRLSPVPGAASAWAEGPPVRPPPRREPPAAAEPPVEPAPVEPPVQVKMPHDARHFALVVGISRYQHELPPSTGSDDDARAFSRFAEEQLGVPRRNLVLALGAQATKSYLDAQLDEWLPRNLDERSTLYVYFAGHGAPDPTTGDAYLLPWEADPRYLKSQGVRLGPLLERVERLPGARKVVFLDACFSGAGGRSVVASGTRPLVPVDRQLAEVPRAGMAVFAAAGRHQTAGTTRDGRHGLFSYFVLQGLEGKADTNRDGKITVEELSAFVADRVADEAARDNREQRPVVLVGAGDGKKLRVR